MRRRSAFTLIEVLIVVIILGILAAAIIPQFTSAASDSRENSTALVTKSMNRKISVEKAKNGTYPATVTADMFEGEQLPRNALFTSVTEPAFATVETDATKLHPATKTSDPATDIVWWYNSGNGIVRALLPDTTASADVVELYNKVNNCAITAANQTN